MGIAIYENNFHVTMLFASETISDKTMCEILTQDLHVLYDKGKQYGDSWKKRGGIGAFMMLARKWDRIQVACDAAPGRYIVRMILDDQRPEGILDDIGDLRRYLLLVIAERKRLKSVEFAALSVLSDARMTTPSFRPTIFSCWSEIESSCREWNYDCFSQRVGSKMFVDMASMLLLLEQDARNRMKAEEQTRIKQPTKVDGMEHPFGFNPQEDCVDVDAGVAEDEHGTVAIVGANKEKT